tara:strand:- start:12554 stop:13135 length:582 start_codon:yes stop_codon:yes gene_type:complete
MTKQALKDTLLFGTLLAATRKEIQKQVKTIQNENTSNLHVIEGPEGPEGPVGLTGLTGDRGPQGEMGGDAGVGSTNILENNDVVFTVRNTIANNDILIYDADVNKFTVTNLATVINTIKDQLELEVQYTKLIDQANTTITYIGESTAGTANTVLGWRIKRIDERADPDVDILWADGDTNFDNAWTDRASKTYS